MEKKTTITTMPAGRGLGWLTVSLLLLRRDPLRLLLLGLVLQFLAGLTQVGAAGIIFVLSVPALSAGMLQALHGASAGARPSLAVLFIAFTRTDRLLRLVMLGGLMLASAIIAVMIVLTGVISDMDPATLSRLEQGDVEVLLTMDPELIQRSMFALLLGLLVSGTLSYFAVPLVWFRDLPLGRAIWVGLVGMLKNWKPLLVLGFLLAVLAIPVALMTALMLGLNAAGSGASPLLTLLMLFMAVAYQLLLFASQYITFRDIFYLPPPPPAKETEDSQLVA